MSKTQARTPFEVLILNQQNLNINRPGEWLKVGRSIAAETNRKVVLVIKDTQSDCDIAQASIWKAEHHSLASEIPFQPGSLEKTIVVDQIKIDHAEQLPALLYLALREGRILKRTNALFFVAGPEHSTVVELLKLKPLRHVPSLIKDGIEYCAYAQVIDYAMHHAFATCNETALALVQEQLSIEVVRTVESWLAEFFQRPWTQAVLNRKLAREQYVSTLYNLHTFVRYTTRLLGRAIALSSDQPLRDHYIEHLKGEINHERIIERDLEYLQEDVEYLLHYKQPNYETKAFLTVQESTLAFYQDPVLFLACPIAAEGVAAYLTQEFLACLYDCVESWGVQSPKRASHMVTSHTGFDGGEDGHWNLTILKVKEHVKTEPRLREFLGVLRTAMNALERSYDSNIEEMRLWEPLRI